MNILIVLFLFFVASPASAIWRDSDFYYKTGAKFQLTTEEQTSLLEIARQRMQAEFSAHYIVDGSSEVPSSFPLPYTNPMNNDYGIYSSTTTSPYYNWGSGGLLFETSNIVNEYETQKDQTIGYGDTSYSCQTLTWDYDMMNCTTPGDGHHNVATMAAKEMTGYKTKTNWIKCSGDWVVSSRYYYGCYRPSNNYPTFSVSSGTAGMYASPSDYQGIQDLRTLLEAAIASATASGMASRGVDITQFTTILNYINEGYPVVSSGTMAGTGAMDNTAGSSTTINVNVEFPDYTINAPTSGDWDVWAATAADSSIITNLIDQRIEQASAALSGMNLFIDKFRVDDSVYDPCVSSACFSMMGRSLGCLNPKDSPLYNTWLDYAKWFIRVMCGIAALVIIFG